MPSGPRPAPPVGTARVAISGTNLGHSWTWVFYLNITASGTVGVDDLQTLAEDMETSIGTHLAADLSSDLNISTVDITYIDSAGDEVRYTSSTSIPGTNSGAVGDASACSVLVWVISAYYRGGHPRSYLPGLPSEYVTNGSDIDPTHLSSLVTHANDVRNDINGLTTPNITGVAMGTVSFQTGGAWRDPPVFRAFTSVKAGKKNKLGSQRRRILA